MSNKIKEKEMKPAEKRALVPKLRFPEFLNSGNWQFSPLNKLAKRSMQKNKDGEYKRVLTNSAEYGVVDQRDYFDKDIATQGKLEGYFIVEQGDYVYNPRISTTAPVGPISKNNIATGVMSPLYTVFRFNDSENDFYAYYFKSAGWHCYMRQASSTGARHDRMAISNDDFMAMPLPTSSPEEQQKIADCLSSIDELVTLEAQKLNTLKAHKKGLMQQLFPAEGETLPKLRFPEFLGAGEWDFKSLGKIGEIVTGKTPSTGDDSLWNGDIQFVTPTDISEEKYQRKTQRSVARNAKTKVLPKYSTMFTCIASIGKMALSVKPCITNQQINTLIPNEYHENEFIYYSLLNIVSLIKGAQANSTLPIINKTEFSKFTVPVPKVHAEQQKIADCLSSLDELITAQTQKLDTLKAHKKGLMQQLFPALDEVDA